MWCQNGIFLPRFLRYLFPYGSVDRFARKYDESNTCSVGKIEYYAKEKKGKEKGHINMMFEQDDSNFSFLFIIDFDSIA